ncbi:MAG: ROK family protein [Elusimicrobiales bacterium]|nr:ROK family protein [Elusimicrobiales bacterium]
MEIIGADLGGTNFRAGRVRGKKVIQPASSPVNAGAAQDAVLEELYRLLDAVMSPEVKGIGAGVPGVVDLAEGTVYEVQNIPAWKKVPLKALLEKRYRVPAYVNNDANCFAAGEKYFGKAAGFGSAVGLTMGTGLGAGIIANGRLYSGANCGAGEFGMIPYNGRNYEYFCSGQFFRDVHNTTGKAAFGRALQGDAGALEMFAEFGSHVGEALKMIMYAVDPEIIILGGSVSKAYPFFKEAMLDSLRSFAWSRARDNVRIEVSDTENSAILGAAALYYDALGKI